MSWPRSIRHTGLALVAVFLLGGIAAASASAAKFEAKAPEGKAGFPVKFTAEGGAGFLQTKKGRTVTCTGKASGSGEVSGEKAVAKVEVTFKGCFAEGLVALKCTTAGAAEGEIKTKAIKGKPVTLGALGIEAGILLEPEGELFAEFKCELKVKGEVLVEETVKVKGSIIGKVPTAQLNEFRKTLNLEFIAALGTPIPLEAEGEKHFLLTKGEGTEPFEYEESGIQEAVPGETKTTALEEKEIKLVP